MKLKGKYRGTIFIRGFYRYSLLKRIERREEELLLITTTRNSKSRTGMIRRVIPFRDIEMEDMLGRIRATVVKNVRS